MAPVEITAREIYDSVQQLHVRMAVVCEKLDRVGPDHEQRIRHLEARRWPLPVIASLAAVAAVAAVTVQLLGWA